MDKEVKKLEFINFGIFPGHCLFAVGHDFASIKKVLRTREYNKNEAQKWITGISQEKANGPEANCALWRMIDNKNTGESVNLFYIIISDFDFKDFDFIVLAHEILHICQFYSINYGPFDRNREIEAEAYLHSHIMKQCIEILRK